MNLPKHATADNVLFVSESGNDANDGRAPGSAKLTIQAAINTFATFGVHGEVRVGAGVFVEDITHNDGISVIGAGSNMTTIKTPAGSTAPGAVQIAPGPVTGMRFEGFRVEGNGNAGQHGIYAYTRARPAPAYGDGGWWYWLRGGGSSYLLPHQFLVFEMVRAFTTKAVNSGQVGQIDFIQSQIDSTESHPHGTTMTVPNIYICPELNDNGTFASEENPHSLTFHTPTMQGGWKDVFATHLCSGIEFLNTHLEGFKYGFHADSGANLVIRGGSFSNVGNGDGSGYWTNTTIGGVISVSNLTGGLRDKTFVSDGNIGSATDVRQGPKGALGAETSGLTKQVSVSGGGALALEGNRTAYCTTSATPIPSITCSATPGESIFISAFTGPLTFSTGSGLQLQGRTTVTVPDKTVSQFVRLDGINVWALVGMIPRDLGAWVTVAAGSFINSWSSVGGVNSPAQYRLTLDGAHVELAGQLTGGVASSVAFVLPVGFRPTKTKTLSAYSIGNGGGSGLQIGNEGNVTVMTGITTPISLDGVMFPIDG